MRFSSTCLLTLALAAFGTANPTPVEVEAAAKTSCTSFRYPGPQVTDYAGETFSLQVRANNPAYNGHNIQLRPSGASALVVVDTASPVLYMELVNGTLYSKARNLYNQYYNLGPIGGLRNITNTKTSAEQAFIFRNVTGSGQSFKQTMDGWYLIGGTETASYNLYQEVSIGYANGFIICPMNGNEYYQLFYNEYLSTPPDYPGCEYVGLTTTIAPSLY